MSHTFQRKEFCRLNFQGGIATAIQATRGLVFLGCKNYSIVVFRDTFPFSQVLILKYPTKVFDIALSHDNRFLLAGGFNGFAQLYSLEINSE